MHEGGLRKSRGLPARAMKWQRYDASFVKQIPLVVVLTTDAVGGAWQRRLQPRPEDATHSPRRWSATRFCGKRDTLTNSRSSQPCFFSVCFLLWLFQVAYLLTFMVHP